MQESVIYHDILQQDVQKGRQAGQVEGSAGILLRLLRSQLGDIPLEVEQRVIQLSLLQLENLADRLGDFSTLADLQNWLVELSQN
jgi:predicted transposase YdaD